MATATRITSESGLQRHRMDGGWPCSPVRPCWCQRSRDRGSAVTPRRIGNGDAEPRTQGNCHRDDKPERAPNAVTRAGRVAFPCIDSARFAFSRTESGLVPVACAHSGRDRDAATYPNANSGANPYPNANAGAISERGRGR
jgi:hypothetical protein